MSALYTPPAPTVIDWSKVKHTVSGRSVRIYAANGGPGNRHCVHGAIYIPANEEINEEWYWQPVAWTIDGQCGCEARSDWDLNLSDAITGGSL